MRYRILNVNAEEIAFKVNRISLPPATKINLSPRFKRQVKTAEHNPNLKLIALSMSIKSTEEDKKPFDLYISFVGNFEVNGADDTQSNEEFLLRATNDLFHYLRTAALSVTASANIAPFMLPIEAPYFPPTND
ncbi:MAG: protein-export chaperone SecB [Clostridia bacterium]|nr:protein-export chaperone SecB [Clostridia bacterium]